MIDYNASISSSNFHREPMLQIQGDKPGSQATGVRHGFGTMSWLIRMFFMKICNFVQKNPRFISPFPFAVSVSVIFYVYVYVWTSIFRILIPQMQSCDHWAYSMFGP